MKKLKYIISLLLFTMILIIVCSGNWILMSFGDTTFAQIIFTIMTSESGANAEVVMDGVLNCVIIPMVFSAIFTLSAIFVKRYILEIYCVKVILKRKQKEYILRYKCLSWVSILFLCIILIVIVWYYLDNVGAIDYYKDINNPGTLYEEW